MMRLVIVAALLVAAVLATGCGVSQEELASAYEQGYADGLVATQAAFEEPDELPPDCRDCYALGFSEGYEQGYAEGSAAG